MIRCEGMKANLPLCRMAGARGQIETGIKIKQSQGTGMYSSTSTACHAWKGAYPVTSWPGKFVDSMGAAQHLLFTS